MRGLKVAVVAMGVLIVAGTVGLIVAMVQRMSPATAGFASALIDEPAGTRILGTSMAPDRLAVQLQGGGPDRVVLLDSRTGRVVGRYALTR